MDEGERVGEGGAREVIMTFFFSAANIPRTERCLKHPCWAWCQGKRLMHCHGF